MSGERDMTAWAVSVAMRAFYARALRECQSHETSFEFLKSSFQLSSHLNRTKSARLQTSFSRPHAPRWRWRFFGRAIDGMLLEHAHAFCDRAFELRIATGDDVLGPVLDVDVGRHAFIFHRPLSIAREEAAARSDRRTAVDERRCVGSVDQAAPGSFAHQQAQLSIMKHVRHQVAAGAGHLVDDHYLRPPDSSRGTGERITISRDVIEITVEVALQHVDDVIGRRAAPVETLIDDRAFLILLREVVTIEAGIAGLPRVRQIDIS